MLRSKNLKVASDQILPRLDKLEKMIADIKEHFQYEVINEMSSRSLPYAQFKYRK